MKTTIKQFIKKFFSKLEKIYKSKSLRYLFPKLPERDTHSTFKYSLIVFLKWSIAIGFWGFTLVSIYLLYVFHDLPDINNLDELKKERKVTILDHSGNVLGNFGDLYGHYIHYYEIPRNLRNAVIATEDRRFFEHFGVDVLGIIRAAYANFKAGHTVQGGSTITQQLAKIVFLSPKRTLKRKVQEALLALQLEYKYSKQQLLAIYLNRVYFGAGLYGIDAASKYYFGKNVTDLNLYESAIIAGLLKAPSRFSPTNNATLSGHRAYQVLLNMYEAGFINQKRLQSASKTPIAIETRMFGSIRRHYFTRWVFDQIPQYTDDNESDLIVKTTLHLKFQRVAEQVLQNKLKTISSTRNVEQGAVVMLGREGNIIAMVGGKDFDVSPFNRATQAKRQPGSSFKLFVYITAMEAGYTPEDKIKDEELYFKDWNPGNYHKNYLGLITLEEAFKKSVNTVAIRLTQEVGVGNVINTARKLGLKEPIDYNLSIALGTASVSLLELTAAYSTVANEGYYTPPYTIQYIKKAKRDEFLYMRPPVEPVKVISNRAVHYMDRLLAETVKSGTAKYARSKFRIAGKTGTSQDWRDAWFLGYTSDVTIGVWLGNDDYTPTKRVSGGTFPTFIARDILRKTHRYYIPRK